MKRILAAIDFSDVTDAVVDTAAQLTKTFDGTLRIIHTEPPVVDYMTYGLEAPFGYGGQDTPIVAPEPTATTATDTSALEIVHHRLGRQGVEADCVQLEGHTAELILKEAETFHADLIVMGTHKHGLFYYLLLGSVRDSVLK